MKRPRGCQPMAADNPFTALIVSPELLPLITAYQDGVFHDMLPFLTLETCPTTGDFSDVVVHYKDLYPILTSWLDAWGIRRLSKLLACMPFLWDIVLYHAIQLHNLPLLDWCLANRTDYSHCLLDMAADANHLDVMELLFSQGHRGCSDHAIDAAIRHGNLSTVLFLRDHCAHIVPDVDAHCIRRAVEHGQLGLLRFFLDLHPRQLEYDLVGLGPAMANGHSDMILFCLTRLPPQIVSSLTRSMLFGASQYGLLPLVQALSPIVRFATPALMDGAAANGHLDVVQWLHANRTEGYTYKAVVSAATFGHLHVLAYLHRQDDGRIAAVHRLLPTIVQNGHLAVAEYVVEHKLVHMQSCTLAIAMASGRLDVLQWWFATFDHSSAPLADAMPFVANGNLEAVRWMFDQGILTDVTSDSLCHAAQNGHLALLQWLHDAGYGRDFDRVALTRGAAALGRVHIIRWLFSTTWGACPRCALGVAETYNHIVTVRVLRSIVARKQHKFSCEACAPTKSCFAALLNAVAMAN
ncbi:Aste57867_24305 [Aphanomyces stellatus]|uniref:Aste57867_24305 protein n=1 Tax=Aphanomyces stellatus TaxID=120398 RepID=A0A485LR65_9STRA|nr:hypothetical protein As57867_024230 [Aphanomyces stellatus]VFU00945.1 Aste57867_24305 [Aphanomyces stellatus]